MKSIAVVVAILLSLTGCVGATVVLPEKQTSPTGAHRILRLKNITPKVSKSEKYNVTREWCGVTLWAVVVPVPLLLPVCRTYSEVAYGPDIDGDQVVLFNARQTISSPMYACGPMMILAPIIHGYEGNQICGMMR
ncbi:hypothetical protein EXN22_25855 [Pseudomonas tructae]|uniref:Lipoprotein n=1 Tax=Pseudomonas tructae TaxID=2518644 RepID=A0A411MQ53_9PSED|nr:hypothetical protein [Pseudomonas tructae]QBF28945.1 hypothetical protein EXN22_25855 [Pseudomonas tructae]